MRRGRILGWLGTVTGAVIVCQNIVWFIILFPGGPFEAWRTPSVIATRLPVQVDTFLPPPPPSFASTITARSVYIGTDSPSPRLVFRRHIDEALPLASVTKLMTALLIQRYEPDWTKEVTIEYSDLRGGVKTPLTRGATVTIGDLWTMSLVASDNNAMAALVRAVVGSEAEFVADMNAAALVFGMDTAHFVEPTGLSPGNVASARDVAILTRLAFANDRLRTTVAQSDSQVTVTEKKVKIFSSEQRLKAHTAGAEGWIYQAAKTGFVDEAGYNMAVLAQTVRGSTIVLVLLGSHTPESREREANELLEWTAKVLDNQT